MAADRCKLAAMNRLVAFLLVLFLMAPGGAALSPARADGNVSNRSLLDAFAKVALGSEYEKRVPKILKWVKPINAAIIGTGYPPVFEKLVVAQFADLVHETGHPIRLVYSETMRREKRLPPDVSRIPVDFLIFYAPKAELPALVEKRTNGAFKAADTAKMVRLGYCHSRLKITSSGELTFAYVAVPSEITTRVDYGKKKVDPKVFLRACVVEELTQSLGLINDVPGLSYSVFSDDSPQVDLTVPDRWMLRMLYDPRVKPGMGPREVLPLMARFLEEFRPDH